MVFEPPQLAGMRVSCSISVSKRRITTKSNELFFKNLLRAARPQQAVETGYVYIANRIYETL